MTIVRAAAMLILASMTSVAEPLAAQSGYQQGRSHWRSARYPEARPPLLTHRSNRGGRTPEVDYMLGTSGCRIDGQRPWGGRVLNLMLYDYPMSAAGRRLVTGERDRCRSPAALVAPSTNIAPLAPGATASGKMWFSGGANPVAAHPANLIRPFSPGELARRLVPLGEADRYREVLTSLAPPNAKVRIVGRFGLVSTGAQSDAQLERMAGTLETFIQFVAKTYELAPPKTFISVYLSPTGARFTAAADRIHNLRISPSTLGYAYPEDMSVSAMISDTYPGTLLHELFHLILRDAHGGMPQWLDEGTASLYEVSRNRAGAFEGLPNWRGKLLAVAPALRPSLRGVITSGWFDFDGISGGTNVGAAEARQLALARYFMLFLQTRGQLLPVFRAMRDRELGAADDPGEEAVQIVERIAGPLPALEASFWTWFTSIGPRDDNFLPKVAADGLPETSLRTASRKQ